MQECLNLNNYTQQGSPANIIEGSTEPHRLMWDELDDVQSLHMSVRSDCRAIEPGSLVFCGQSAGLVPCRPGFKARRADTPSLHYNQ